MSYQIRFSRDAEDDLGRLYAFQLERGIEVAERALHAIVKSMELLRDFPFACRKAAPDNPFLRELLITFGSSGYVALYEIENDDTVTIVAVRHQLEDDYH